MNELAQAQEAAAQMKKPKARARRDRRGPGGEGTPDITTLMQQMGGGAGMADLMKGLQGGDLAEMLKGLGGVVCVRFH